MKVTAITPTKNTKTGGDMWRVQFEEDTKSMWLGFAPTFTAGDTIDDAKIQVSSTGKSWVFKKKEEGTSTTTEPPKSEPKKSYGKTPSEMHSIECQTKMNNTREIYNHCTEQGTPFDGELLLKIYQSIADIMRNDGALISEVKKMGGVEE